MNYSIKSNLLFASLLVLIFIMSCNKDESSETLRKYRLAKITLIFKYSTEPDTSISRLFYTNTGLLHKIETNRELTAECSYSDGKLVKLSIFDENHVETNYRSYSWNGNVITIEYSDIRDYKSIIHLNSDGEVILAESFYKIDGEWIKESYFNYEWDNGNLLKLESYQLRDEYKAKSPAKKSNNPIFTNLSTEQVCFSLRSPAARLEYNKVYEMKYTFDDKFNPYADFQYSQISHYPVSHSKNNILTFTLSHFYEDGSSRDEVIRYSYQYNQKLYPENITEYDPQYENPILIRMEYEE